MALSELDRAYPLFDWEASNGAASGEQTRTAYWALGNQGECARFSYLVWNDMVDALLGLLEALGVGAVSVGLRMSETDKALTADRFNAFRKNLEEIWRPGWPWALEEKPGWLSYPAASFLGRTDMVGAAQAGEDADVVYGWYLLELVRKLNILTRVLRGDDVAVELAYGAAMKTLKCAAALAAGAVYSGADRASRSGEAGRLLGAQAGFSAAERHSASRGRLFIEVVRWARLLGAQDILTRGRSAPTVFPCCALPHEKRGGTAHFAGVLHGAGVCASSFAALEAGLRGAAAVSRGVCGAFAAAEGTGYEAAGERFGAVYAAGASDSRSAGLGSMITPRIEEIIELGAVSASRTEAQASEISALPLTLGAENRPLFRCEAGLLTLGASAAASCGAWETGTLAALDFEGVEEVWLAPIQAGSDLYIRSVWRSYEDGSGVYLDTDVFYAPMQKGSDLYIRSLWRFWRDGSRGSADTDVFLEPVQNGSSLYIRQDIFGGA